MNTLCVVPFEARSVNAALGIARAALTSAETRHRVVLASSLLEAQGRILGARQRLQGGETETTWRRATTGTTVLLRGRVLHHALALPQVNALETDATWPTLLNRNLRAFLRAYTGLGVPAQYFGRETISLRRQPFAVCGLETTPAGAVLIEVFVGFDGAVAEPRGAASTKSLRDILQSDVVASELAARVEKAFVHRYSLTTESLDLGPLEAQPERTPPSAGEITTRDVPIGSVEAMIHQNQVQIFGDMLTADWALTTLETNATCALQSGNLDAAILAPFDSAPLFGARPEDFLNALRDAANAVKSAR